MATLDELISQKEDEIKARRSNGIETIKPLAGKHKYRILPSWRGEDHPEGNARFWHEWGQHWLKPAPGAKAAAVVACTDKSYGKPCDICQSITHIMASTDDDELREHIKGECRAQLKYLLNVLHLTGDKPTEVQILEIPGSSVFEEGIVPLLKEYSNPENSSVDNLTDLKSKDKGGYGMDIVIEKSGSGFDTKYSVLPAAKSITVPAKIMSKLNNLDELVADEFTDTAAKKALTVVAGMAGIELADSSKAIGFVPPDVIEDAELETLDWDSLEAEAAEEAEAPVAEAEVEAPEAEVEAPEAEAPEAEVATADSADDIEAMLADLD